MGSILSFSIYGRSRSLSCHTFLCFMLILLLSRDNFYTSFALSSLPHPALHGSPGTIHNGTPYAFWWLNRVSTVVRSKRKIFLIKLTSTLLPNPNPFWRLPLCKSSDYIKVCLLLPSIWFHPLLSYRFSPVYVPFNPFILYSLSPCTLCREWPLPNYHPVCNLTHRVDRREKD